MPILPPAPRLQDVQRYVADLERERGFDAQSVRDKCLLLGEELGELFRAVRRAEGLTVDPASRTAECADELADCLIYLCAIANRYGLDLEAAFRAKEVKNAGRTWSALPSSNSAGSLAGAHAAGERSSSVADAAADGSGRRSAS